MSDESDYDHIDLVLISLALVDSGFDLDKAAKRLEGLGEKRRMLDVLARAEVSIDKLERDTRDDPESWLVIRRVLADIRKGLREKVK